MGYPEKAVAYIEMEDYLVLEQASRYKHEYLKGVVYAIQGEPARGMAGRSQTHSRLIRNATLALHGRLQGTPCEVLFSEMRLRVRAAEAMFYPDVLVHCTPTEDPAHTVELTEARLVLEVLSPSTQVFDKGDKLKAYRLLPGLQHIVLLDSQQQQAWACHRDTTEGEWQPLLPWVRGTNLPLASLGLEIAWGEIYDGVGLQ